MTLSKLQGKARKWQRILLLQDWNISVFFAVTEKTRDGHYDLGFCDCSPFRKSADIVILEPRLWRQASRIPGYRGLDKEIELTLIHEMIHCHFDCIKQPKADSADDLIIEHGVESLARAFFDNI